MPTSPDRKPLSRNVVSPPSQAVAGDLRRRQKGDGPQFFTDRAVSERRDLTAVGIGKAATGTVRCLPSETLPLVKPTANAVRPVLHPPHSGAVAAVRATLRRASSWPRSRFSARDPGWPACLDHGQGSVALTGNLGCQPGRPRKPRRLGATSSLPAHCRDSAAGSERQIAHYLHPLQANYIPQFVFREAAQAVLGQNRSRNIVRTLDLDFYPITSRIALS